MKNIRSICSLMLLSLLAKNDSASAESAAVSSQAAGLWNGFMGGARDVHADEREVIPRQNPVMHRAWNTAISTGYSGVSLIDDTAITMYSDHQSDYVIALNTTSGAERWRYKIGPTYKGHGNSQDGPFSTPLVRRDRGGALELGRRSVTAATLSDPTIGISRGRRRPLLCSPPLICARTEDH